MGNNKQQNTSSRRGFFASLMGGKAEKVKMLTPDGKLVEVDKSVLDRAAKKKASNKDIFDWMENPSKDQS